MPQGSAGGDRGAETTAPANLVAVTAPHNTQRLPAMPVRRTECAIVTLHFCGEAVLPLADSDGSRPAPGGGALKSLAGEDNLPVPPAVPSSEKTDGPVSFDDFFGSEAEKATSALRGGRRVIFFSPA